MFYDWYLRNHQRLSVPWIVFSIREKANSLFVLQILALLLLGAFAVCLTMLLKYILNPDKAPLPWRDYCQSPYPDYFALNHPPHFNYTSEEHQIRLSMEKNLLTLPGASADLLQMINSTHPAWPFPKQRDLPYSAESNLVDALDPVGLFIGVFSTDEGRERRMMIRQTYGTHPKSRVSGTEGVRLRFVMGRPRVGYERAVKLEMDSKLPSLICQRIALG